MTMAGVTSASDVDRADRHPLVAAVSAFARDELRPRMLDTDRDGVPAATIDRLRELGALNYPRPDREVARRRCPGARGDGRDPER